MAVLLTHSKTWNKKTRSWISFYFVSSISPFISANSNFFSLFLWNWIYPSRITKKVRDKSITYNIFRIQDNDAFMCGLYCIAFIWYMLAGKTLSNYTNLFSPNDYKKNDKIVYKYFKDKYVKSGV